MKGPLLLSRSRSGNNLASFSSPSLATHCTTTTRPRIRAAVRQETHAACKEQTSASKSASNRRGGWTQLSRPPRSHWRPTVVPQYVCGGGGAWDQTCRGPPPPEGGGGGGAEQLRAERPIPVAARWITDQKCEQELCPIVHGAQHKSASLCAVRSHAQW